MLVSRLAGHEVERVLVDVSPYSFGVSYLGERGAIPYPHCYKPIIRRNSPLPITRSEPFYTSHPYQEEVKICVYEGEDEDALRDILVGDFQVNGLTPMRDLNEMLCRMSLDLDGILQLTAIEKCSGLSKHVTIARALEAKSAVEIAKARKRLEALYATWQGEQDIEEEGALFDTEGALEIEDQESLEGLQTPAKESAGEEDWGVWDKLNVSLTATHLCKGKFPNEFLWLVHHPAQGPLTTRFDAVRAVPIRIAEFFPQNALAAAAQ